MQPHLLLFVPAFGAACSGFLLTMLGFAYVPFDVSLWVVVGLGLASAIAVGRSERRAGPASLRVWLPLFIAALIAAVALIPMFRTGTATVIGQNGDSVQWVGSMEVLQEATPPSEINVELPLDRVPLVWRSKYPIYYVASAVDRLSGLEAHESFPIISAGLHGVLALAFFAFAFHVLRAGPLASLAAMAVVPLSRWVLYLPIHPYYNQLWGLLLLALAYVFGFRFLLDPGRRSAAAAVLFGALGAFAYPLALPFPVIALGLSAWLIRRRSRARGEPPVRWIAALRLPRPRSALAWIPLGLLALPFLLVLVLGVVEKLGDFAEILLPGRDLSQWRGGDPYLDFPAFFGIPGTTVLSVLAAVAVIVVGALRTWQCPREIGLPLIVAGALGLLGAGYFRLRHEGELLYFRSLGFSAPFLLAAAAVGLAELARRREALGRAAAAGLAVLIACAVLSTREELEDTFAQLTPDLLQLREFGAGIPPGASIRIDLPPDAYQLWARHLLHEHPLSVRQGPVGTIFPHPPVGRKADYVLGRATRPPRDAVGEPVASNATYGLYLMRPSVPGRDRSSRELIDAYSAFRE
jgi:hypothetical protein